MRPREASSDSTVRCQELLKMLTRTLKYLEDINVDPAVLKSYKQLLRHLRSLSAENISNIFENSKRRVEPLRDSGRQLQLLDQDILAMSVEKIAQLASNPKVPRKHLERIASVRFGVTRGALSMLRSRDALADKLRTLIGHEGAHDSIARVAGNQW